MPIKVFEIQPDRGHQAYLNSKAQRILELIDANGEPPQCECGYCRR